MADKLTKPERDLLAEIALRPNGAMVRGVEEQDIVRRLADKVLVCDPHALGNTLFTRITDAGREALAHSQG